MAITMTLTINGETQEHPIGTTMLVLLNQRVGDQRKGIAVAKNGKILSRHQWHENLSDGDQIEIIVASQGG